MADMSLSDKRCVICRGAFIDNDDKGGRALITRGLETFIEFSYSYADTELTNYLTSASPAV